MAKIWSVALRGALDAFTAMGLDAEMIRERAGIERERLADPDARIPLFLAAKIWPAAAAQWGRDGLGLNAGGALAFGRLEALDYALATAGTVGEGLERLSRYWDVVTAGETAIRLVRGTASERDHLEFLGYALPDLRDYALAASVARLDMLGVAPLHVAIAGPPAASVREYAARFRCDVSFDGDVTSLVLGEDALARPIPARFPGLRATVDRELTRLLSLARASGDPLAEIRREITSLVGPSPPTLDVVAARLGTTRRRLQRTLALHDQSFSKLLDECRHALAELHLRDGMLGVAEIAYLLGYSEPSAFSRAYKRWTGLSPERHRHPR